MSQGITHFAVGATATTLLVTFLIPNVRYPRMWVLVGGGWAMLPDAGKLVSHRFVDAVHYSRWGDLFWVHYTMDRVDVGDSTLAGAVALALFALATAVAERRGYRALGTAEAAGNDA